MEFHHYASNETSALIARLLANQSGSCLQQLHAIREAIDAAARALETPAQTEHEIHELIGRLTAAAQDDTRRIAEEARHAIDAAHAELKGQRDENARLAVAIAKMEAETVLLKSELHTAYERAENAERDLVVTVDAHTELDAALRHAEAQSRQAAQAQTHLESELAAARGNVDRAAAETDHLRKELDQLRHEIERQQHEKHALEAELRDARHASHQQRDAIAAELQSNAARVESLEAELTSRAARVQALETELSTARAGVEKHEVLAGELELSQARVHTLEAARAKHEQHIRELQTRLDEALRAEAKLREAVARANDRPANNEEQTEALRWELERMVSLFDGSVRAVNEMAKARSSSDLLSELVKRMSIQFSRVALFRVKGNGLDCEQQIGFDDTDITKLVLPITVDSLLTRALASGTLESLQGADVPGKLGTPFGGSPTSAVALPIAVHGTTLAVVYADDSDMPESARGPAVHESSVGFAKLLMGEANVMLMCHTHELKMLGELRQYANTLLQEAKQIYLADAEAGKPAAHLRGRLKDNLECASQLYTYRAAMEGTAAAALLDEQIAAEMAGTGAFARDLAAIVAEMNASDLAVTAEAS